MSLPAAAWIQALAAARGKGGMTGGQHRCLSKAASGMYWPLPCEGRGLGNYRSGGQKQCPQAVVTSKAPLCDRAHYMGAHTFTPTNA